MAADDVSLAARQCLADNEGGELGSWLCEALQALVPTMRIDSRWRLRGTPPSSLTTVYLLAGLAITTKYPWQWTCEFTNEHDPSRRVFMPIWRMLIEFDPA
jgi:hypothetical protein